MGPTVLELQNAIREAVGRSLDEKIACRLGGDVGRKLRRSIEDTAGVIPFNRSGPVSDITPDRPVQND